MKKSSSAPINVPTIPALIVPELPSSTEATDAALVLKSAGQRRINLAWEITQSVIAIMVTGAMIYCALNNIDTVVLGNAFTLIVALYFVRTNHTKVGGIGNTTDSR